MSGQSPYRGLDLANILARKADKPQAEIVGVVTMKGDSFEQVKAQIAEQSIDVEDAIEMEDGSIVFKQGSADLDGESSIIRVNDHVALISKGFNPYSMDMAVGDRYFEDVCKSQGFYPGIGTVMSVLRDSVSQLTSKSDSPADAADAVARMFDEAKAYVTKMVASLPSVAFKMELVTGEV